MLATAICITLNEQFTDIKKFTFHNVISVKKLFTCKSHDAIRLGSSGETQVTLIEMV